MENENLTVEKNVAQENGTFQERLFFLDNIRWITILLVVVFHIFFYYNNIGTMAMFQRLPDYEAGKVSFAGIFQYSVYQWFMVLLFAVSGICANISLKKKSVKEFLKSRACKLLVPSTLGILCVQWVCGWLISFNYMNAPESQNIPGFVKYIIYVASGTGALWFCQVLFFACLMLAILKCIDKNDRVTHLSEKSEWLNIVVLAALFFVMWGSAQILNVPKITTYRMLYYPMAFFIGYYWLSSKSVLDVLKKLWWLFLAAGIVSGVFYVKKNYGTYYAEYSVLNNWLSVFHAWFTTLGILGVSQTVLNFHNKFSDYMTKISFGIFVLHIFVLLLVNTLLKPVAQNLPIAVIYIIELVAALAGSVLLWELLSRIPVVRFVLFGIKKSK
ncbi:MAG: acyltransferase [Spirochaetia bacterium]|nr:acyltransferase [Spirochaetia bacterium]MCI7588660.1 acyltransferase [Spirochaetia bacterium]